MDKAARESDGPDPERRFQRVACMTAAVAALATFGASGDTPGAAPAVAQASAMQLPAPPPGGTMGFVVHQFHDSVIQEKGACPEGFAIKTRDTFLAKLPPEERERIQKPENAGEFNRRWVADMSAPGGINICSQFAKFPDRPTLRTVQSKFAWGLDLDGDQGNGSSNPEGCAHDNFVSPTGEKGIDNQAYRALGCTIERRGADGVAGDIVRGYAGFLASGEWTQVILIRGIDSFVRDDSVEVIYANSPDRPVLDASGKFLSFQSFKISDTAPRYRNVLRGRIENGVLTTEPADIKLTQTWGQSATRDLRGARGKWDFRKARLRLTFMPDGSLKGLLGGYQPIGDLLLSVSLGGLGAAMTAGIDCAGEYNTMKKLADGLRDPKTGQCTGISNAMEVQAVPAFVNDLPARPRIASK